jgi:hypothetical protein
VPVGTRGNLSPTCPPLVSLNLTPYRVMLGILGTQEHQAPWGSLDYQDSLGFGALWGQKEKRLVFFAWAKRNQVES